MKLRKGLLRSIASVAAAAAMVLTPAAAFAAGPGGGARGGGGGGGETGETTVTNNLSVPAVFIGGTGSFALQNTTGALVYPAGAPSTGFEVAGYYYVQGVHAWQAQYVIQDTDTVTAKWGDNLTGSAMKRVGHQIRVEMGLTSATQTALQGFSVIKLNESQADNVSPWGTLATPNGDGTYSATAATMAAKVWVAGAQVRITSPSGIVKYADMPGEINASGAVTFGYNWKPTEAGTYKLEFLAPAGAVTFTNPDATVLAVNITGGGGGGGGGARGGGR